jgi:3',5'-cyclic-AMP phosphodiesterase
MKTSLKNTDRAVAHGPRSVSRHPAPSSGSNTYTIVHISDPHLSHRYYREHIKSFQTLLRNVIETGFDHMIISGDIVSTGDVEDFYVARKMLSRYDLLDSRRLTVVPGNHDIFGGPHRAVDVLSFPKYIRNVDYHRNLALFNETFTETFDGARTGGDGSLYPFVKTVGPFAIIGLNSVPTWSLLHNPVGSNGSVSDEQFAMLERMIGDPVFGNKIPIVAIHHHFNHLVSDAAMRNTVFRQVESQMMRLRKRRKLLKLFNDLNVGYIFHGHIHRNEVYSRSGIQLVNGAGAVCNDPVRSLKYNRLRFAYGVPSLTTYTLPITVRKPPVADTLQKLRNDIRIHRGTAIVATR